MRPLRFDAEAMTRGAWEGPFETCPERFDAIASNLARLEAEGITSVVVFMPMSSNRVSMFEGGREEIAGILAEIEAVALAAGADAVIDLSALLPDSQFRDLSHADASGAMAITDAVAARLAELGL